MISLTTEQRTAIAQRRLVLRQFIWCDARNPETGAPDPAGFWNDVGDVTVDGKLYYGRGGLVGISSLGAKGDLTISSLTISFSGVDDAVNAVARGKAIAQAPVAVRLGLFDPDTRTLIPPLIDYFVGVVNDCTIPTPAAGGRTTIAFECVSASRALTRTSRATRSHASEVERAAGDQFYLYTGLQRHPLYFGRKAPADVQAAGAVGAGFSGSIARA